MTTDLIITASGKYESEPRWVPEFWGRNEEADYDFGQVLFFTIEPKDVAQFPELAGVYGVALEEDNQGFVWSSTYDTKDAFDTAVDMVENLPCDDIEFFDGEGDDDNDDA